MKEKPILLQRFGRQLRVFRKQRMISREELGQKAGLSTKDIEELEAGKEDPKLSTISVLAGALDLSTEELLCLSEGHDSEYYAYRFHILQLVNTMSKQDLKKVIENVHRLSGKGQT